MPELTFDALMGAYWTASDLFDKALKENNAQQQDIWLAEMERINKAIEARNKETH